MNTLQLFARLADNAIMRKMQQNDSKRSMAASKESGVSGIVFHTPFPFHVFVCVYASR